MKSLVIVRPQPGADRTAARARELGWTVVTAPIFTVSALAWHASGPDAYDGLMLTSANAARLAGPGLRHYRALPAFAVGSETARAAAAAGLRDVQAGAQDAAALIEMMHQAGVRRPLHLAGRDHRRIDRAGMRIDVCPVYDAVPVETLPDDAQRAFATGAIALIHSPRAGATLARLLGAAGLDPATIRIAAISAAAAAAGGWREAAVAVAPNDAALLAAAARLCEKS